MTDTWARALLAYDVYKDGVLLSPRVKGLNFVGVGSVEVDTVNGYTTVWVKNVKHREILVSEVISSGNVTIDPNLAISTTLVMNASITGTLTISPLDLNEDEASVVRLQIKQAGSGSYTINAWSANVEVPGGTAPTLSTAVGSVDVITACVDGTDDVMRFVASTGFQS